MLPPLCKHLGMPTPVVGGWMYSSIKRLSIVESHLELAVATVYSGNTFQKYLINGITYYLLPLHGKSKLKYHKWLEPLWRRVLEDYSPNLVHLHGTEFPHGLAFLRNNVSIKTVVSIQGLVSVCSRYYLGGLSFKDIIRNITFRDIIRYNNLWQQRKDFSHRGIYECEIIARSNNIIGRTNWDKAHCMAISPDAKYYFCNETLREEFYKHSWKYQECEKHSLFLSQAGYPIKGLHIVLKALSLVRRHYPDAKLYVAGPDIRGIQNFESKLRRGGYGNYILRLIKKMKLEECVYFTGALEEQQICKQYLNSNIFICPSSIENSPNSLGEAQLLGVPCIASYVGGTPDMMLGYERGMMYRFEEVEMLAMYIEQMFEERYSDDMQNNPSIERHDPNINANNLINIYRAIIGQV